MVEGGGERNGMEGIVVGMFGSVGRGGKLSFGIVGPMGVLGRGGKVGLGRVGPVGKGGKLG